MTGTELVPSIAIEQMIGKRQQIEALLDRAREILLEADAISRSAHFGFVGGFLTVSGGGYREYGSSFLGPGGVPAMLKCIDQEGWGYLMRESGLRTFMDCKTRAEWDKAFYDKTYPPFELEAVAGTFKDLYAKRGTMFEEGVINVFKRLSWDYKTNNPFRFGKRVILNYIANRYHTGRNADEVDDLIRVFHVLDGKPEPDHRRGIAGVISDARIAGQQQAETEYYKLRWFKNNNAHMTFKRPDLVTELNRIIAKHYPGALAAQN